ncbi:glycosyltransferase [Phycisphaerae bacterium RAS1]|nr:glycosyltransferase [Phycisphaerae bacterium RAS1]
MTLKLTYLWRNLTRNPVRSLLTCAAVGLPILIYVLSISVIHGIERFLDNSAQQLRLAVTHKTSIINPLPAGHRQKIESLDPTHARILTVCGVRWIGGQIKDDPRQLTTLAVDHDTFASTFPDFGLKPDEQAAWLRDRQALAAGGATATQFGWKVGDKVTIWPSVPPYVGMEFHIVSIGPDAADPTTCWCRRDYLDEGLKNTGAPGGLVSFFFLRCASKDDLEHFRVAIDELFARTPDETLTQDEKAFMNQFITQQFNLPRNLSILAAATVFVAIMAAANTMSMNFRDRLNEYATLKSLGFRSGLVFSLIQSESMLLCAIGGLAGAATPFIAFNYTPLREVQIPLILTLQVAAADCLAALGISLLIGVISAIWPSLMAARLHVVAALRNLE